MLAGKTAIPLFIVHAMPRTPRYRPCQPRCRSQSTLSRRAPCFPADCSTAAQCRALSMRVLSYPPAWLAHRRVWTRPLRVGALPVSPTAGCATCTWSTGIKSSRGLGKASCEPEESLESPRWPPESRQQEWAEGKSGPRLSRVAGSSSRVRK
jgi:hypothetical protein